MSAPRVHCSAWIAALLIAVSSAASTAAVPQRAALPPQLGVDAQAMPLRTADYVGHVLVVTFWASWCAPCLEEMRVLERLQREARSRLAVVSVNIESAARFDGLQRALSKRLRLTLAHDADGSVRAAWGVGPVPHLFLIDHEGRLAYEHRGYDVAFIPALVAQVEALLQRQAAATPPTGGPALRR